MKLKVRYHPDRDDTGLKVPLATAAALLLAAGTAAIQPHTGVPQTPDVQHTIMQESPGELARKLRRAAEEERARKEALEYCVAHAGPRKQDCERYYDLLSAAIDRQAPAERLAEVAARLKPDFMMTIDAESDFNPEAVSPKGALGLTQVHDPVLFKRYASRKRLKDGTIEYAPELSKWQRAMMRKRERHLLNVENNIAQGAARYLEQTRIAQYLLCDKPGYHRKHDHEYTPEVKALRDAFYNHGTGRVADLLATIEEKHPRASAQRKLQLLYPKLPQETRNYIRGPILAARRY